MRLLMKLQDDLRSGNLSVKHGKRFGRFEDYFLPKDRWEPLRKSFFQRSGLALDPKTVGDYLKKRLDTAYDLFLKTAPANTYAKADEDGWHLSTDPAETLDAEAQTRLSDLKKWLTKHMRTVRLPDLLIEVDNDLRFTDHFVPPPSAGDVTRKTSARSWPSCWRTAATSACTRWPRSPRASPTSSSNGSAIGR